MNSTNDKIHYVVVRRQFTANRYPKGSAERAKLNEDWRTSEYQPSHRYGLCVQGGERTPFTYRTKREAETGAQTMGRLDDKGSSLKLPAVREPEHRSRPQSRGSLKAFKNAIQVGQRILVLDHWIESYRHTIRTVTKLQTNGYFFRFGIGERRYWGSFPKASQLTFERFVAKIQDGEKYWTIHLRAPNVDDPIRTLTCCVCGESTRGRQWWNRDAGYGICARSVTWLKGRQTLPEEMLELYGYEGVHYNVRGEDENSTTTLETTLSSISHSVTAGETA